MSSLTQWSTEAIQRQTRIALRDGTLTEKGFPLRDFAGRCERPTEKVAYGEATAYGHTVGQFTGTVDHLLVVRFRCGRCDQCRKAKQRFWARRAFNECLDAQNVRTYFLTLTFNPKRRRRMLSLWLKKGYTGQPEARFQDQYGKHELQRYLKRVRRAYPGTVRFLSTVEEHKDGWIHYHLLVHCKVNGPTTKVLRKKWKFGITHCVLAQRKDIFYVCKYVAKAIASRVRSSSGYGRADNRPPVSDDLRSSHESGGGKPSAADENRERSSQSQ